MSRDFPGYQAMRKAEEALAARAQAMGVDVAALGAVGLGMMGGGEGGAGGLAGAGMAGVGGGGPAGGPASARLAQELRGLEGIPVRTVTSFVTVPAGAALDVDEILAQSDKPLVSAGDVAAAGAREAARQAIGGILGRGRREEARPAEPAPPTAPTVTMRVTQWVEGVRVGPIPEDRFQVPAGYREVR